MKETAPPCTAEFEIPTDHPALPGHFPGHPIVPGALLLQEALARLGGECMSPAAPLEVLAAKFPAPAPPGQRLCLEVQEAPDACFRFRVFAASTTYLEGRVRMPPDGAS